MGEKSISLSWSISGDSVVVGSEVVWRAISDSGDSVASGYSGTISSTSYTILALQELSVYSITVIINTSSSDSFS